MTAPQSHLASKCIGIGVVIAGDLAHLCHIQAIFVPSYPVGLVLPCQNLLHLHICSTALMVYQGIHLDTLMLLKGDVKQEMHSLQKMLQTPS